MAIALIALQLHARVHPRHRTTPDVAPHFYPPTSTLDKSPMAFSSRSPLSPRRQKSVGQRFSPTQKFASSNSSQFRKTQRLYLDDVAQHLRPHIALTDRNATHDDFESVVAVARRLTGGDPYLLHIARRGVIRALDLHTTLDDGPDVWGFACALRPSLASVRPDVYGPADPPDNWRNRPLWRRGGRVYK